MTVCAFYTTFLSCSHVRTTSAHITVCGSDESAVYNQSKRFQQHLAALTAKLKNRGRMKPESNFHNYCTDLCPFSSQAGGERAGFSTTLE